MGVWGGGGEGKRDPEHSHYYVLVLVLDAIYVINNDSLMLAKLSWRLHIYLLLLPKY